MEAFFDFLTSHHVGFRLACVALATVLFCRGVRGLSDALSKNLHFDFMDTSILGARRGFSFVCVLLVGVLWLPIVSGFRAFFLP